MIYSIGFWFWFFEITDKIDSINMNKHLRCVDTCVGSSCCHSSNWFTSDFRQGFVYFSLYRDCIWLELPAMVVFAFVGKFDKVPQKNMFLPVQRYRFQRRISTYVLLIRIFIFPKTEFEIQLWCFVLKQFKLLVFSVFLFVRKTLQRRKNDCNFAVASPTQLAPLESPRVGTQQGYIVVAVWCR